MAQARLLLIPIFVFSLHSGLSLAVAPSPDQTQTMQAVSHSALPTRGMKMDQVEQRFGPPLKRHKAVGEPPITRWDYDGMSVYFEYQQVLHAVINQE